MLLRAADICCTRDSRTGELAVERIVRYIERAAQAFGRLGDRGRAVDQAPASPPADAWPCATSPAGAKKGWRADMLQCERRPMTGGMHAMSEQKSRYSIVIQWSDEDNAYIVRLPEWGNLIHTHGDRYDEALQRGKELLEALWLHAAHTEILCRSRASSRAYERIV